MRQLEYELMTKQYASNLSLGAVRDEVHIERSRASELEKQLDRAQQELKKAKDEDRSRQAQSKLLYTQTSSSYQSKIDDLQTQLQKHTNSAVATELDLCRERDKNDRLSNELSVALRDKEKFKKDVRCLESANDGLQTQLLLVDSSLKALQEENESLRSDFERREGDLVAQLSERDSTLVETRLALDKAAAENSMMKLSFEEAKEDARVAREGAAQAKQRLEQSVAECCAKVSSMNKRVDEAVQSSTSEIKTRMKQAEGRVVEAERRSETAAHESRVAAEAEIANLRIEVEEKLSEQRKKLKGDFERIIESKTNELEVMNQHREADAMQLNEIRKQLACQETTHKREEQCHVEKVAELASELERALQDAREEKERSDNLSLELRKTQSTLESLQRQNEAGVGEHKQAEALLSREISLLKDELANEREERQSDASDYRLRLDACNEQVDKFRDELDRQRSAYISEIGRLERGVISAMQAVFDESRTKSRIELCEAS